MTEIAPGLSLVVADCLDALRELDADSVDAICTDPPYLIGFMGKEFDEQGGAHLSPSAAQRWHGAWATEALRVLKPGGHALVFGGTRTYHRLACGLEDAGFEIRDCLAWMFGSGFPKSLDVAKAIDKAQGVEGGGVRPGHEDFVDRTDKHAAGGRSEGWERPWQDDADARERHHLGYVPGSDEAKRWQGWGTALKPAFEPIVVLDEEAAERLDEQTGELVSGDGNVRRESGADRDGNRSAAYGAESRPAGSEMVSYGDRGGASRFFYVAKVSRAERNAGLGGVIEGAYRNTHPT